MSEIFVSTSPDTDIDFINRMQLCLRSSGIQYVRNNAFRNRHYDVCLMIDSGGDAVFFAPDSHEIRDLADMIADGYSVPEYNENIETDIPTILYRYLQQSNSAAENIVRSLCVYFGIPFVMPEEITWLNTDRAVNLLKYPHHDSEVRTSVPCGSSVMITGKTGEWYVAYYNGFVGYIHGDDISIKETLSH